jgi:hypothetical protein
MKRYRILKRESLYWTLSVTGKTLSSYIKPEYIVQKRFLGFLWWYNFENIDGMTTGCYDTLEEAQLAIKRHRHGLHYNEKVVEEYE